MSILYIIRQSLSDNIDMDLLNAQNKRFESVKWATKRTRRHLRREWKLQTQFSYGEIVSGWIRNDHRAHMTYGAYIKLIISEVGETARWIGGRAPNWTTWVVSQLNQCFWWTCAVDLLGTTTVDHNKRSWVC